MGRLLMPMGAQRPALSIVPRRPRIRDATAEIERVGDPALYFAAVADNARAHGREGQSIGVCPPEVRLALEMAANEDFEHRAFEGELDLLERA